MARPVTLFTGQWADLPLETLCKKARDFGYDGLELACWGDHFEVDKAISDDTYCGRKRDLLEKHDLQLFADLEPPRRPVRARQHRRPPQENPAASTSGATASPTASAAAPSRK